MTKFILSLLFTFILGFTVIESFCQTEDPNEKIYEIFDIKDKPEFPGGDQALMKFIATNVQYPEKAMNAGMSGTVYVKFCVSKTGKVGDINIMKTSGYELLDNEGMRVVSLLPDWKPGQMDGKNVSVWFILPVKFKLSY